jgi:solute carrier family 35 protein F1/2
MSDSKDQVTVQTAQTAEPTSQSLHKDSAITVVQSDSAVQTEEDGQMPADKVDESKKGFFAFLKTKEFYIIVVLGYVLLAWPWFPTRF